MSVKRSKMLGCRVVNEVDSALRERAENEGKTVNDLMNEILNREFDGSPEIARANVTNSTTEVSQKIMQLRAQIEELKKSDDSFFGDDDVKACINALKVEIKELVNSLSHSDNKEEEAKNWDWS